jgi:hypothetical protein
LAQTAAYARSKRERNKVEALFSELKLRVGLRRVRLRRLWNVSEQFYYRFLFTVLPFPETVPHFCVSVQGFTPVGIDQLAAYIAKRKAEKQPAANGTINRELALLRRAFTLGYKSRPRKVSALLDLSEFMLEENNVRTSFVDESQYRVLRDKATGQGRAT